MTEPVLRRRYSWEHPSRFDIVCDFIADNKAAVVMYVCGLWSGIELLWAWW